MYVSHGWGEIWGRSRAVWYSGRAARRSFAADGNWQQTISRTINHMRAESLETSRSPGTLSRERKEGGLPFTRTSVSSLSEQKSHLKRPSDWFMCFITFVPLHRCPKTLALIPVSYNKLICILCDSTHLFHSNVYIKIFIGVMCVRYSQWVAGQKSRSSFYAASVLAPTLKKLFQCCPSKLP